VTFELARLHRELAEVEVAQQQARAEALRSTNAPNITTAKAEADVLALDFTCDALRLRADIAAHKEEKDYLLAMVEYMRGA
jgi:hypothetical protein